MWTAIGEVDRAIAELGLTSDACRKCGLEESVAIFSKAKAAFVEGDPRTWWWESFREQINAFQVFTNDGWLRLLELVPAHEERAWFLPEWRDPVPPAVYDATIDSIRAILGECHAFEYYVIGKRLDWLLSENHHDFVSFARGDGDAE